MARGGHAIDTPQTRYAPKGDLSLAYQVLGEGPFDLVYVPGGISHVDLAWGDRNYARFMRRLASFSRLIVFDKQGMGASDPAPRAPALGHRVDDIVAVMEAAGSERAALLGVSEGGPAAALFAATYPERTRSLVMYGTFPCGDEVQDPDPELTDDWLAFWSGALPAFDAWGTGETLRVFAPALYENPRIVERWAAFERAATTPAMARTMAAALRKIDLREVLPNVRVPTLVVHRTEDPLPVAGARYVAARIPGARLVELPGDDHIPHLGDADALADEVEEFLTGARAPAVTDRMLATVLFTDIAGSTQRAAEIGDRRWSELLEDHHGALRRQLDRFGGNEVKTIGDGMLATFDGPARAVHCATAAVEAAGGLGLDIRAGLHAGECERLNGDVGGIAVHIGARVAALADPGEVLVSSTVKDLVVGSDIAFSDRGSHALKGVPGEWRLFAVAA